MSLADRLIVALFALVAFITVGCGSSSGIDSEEIVQFADEGRQHVAEGTPITYNTDPPTSGTHYPIPQPGGFYTTDIQPGYLVHTMEHGGIIIYYNDSLNAAEQDEIEAIIQPHIGQFATVVAVPRDDLDFPIILTAWRHWQRLRTYDPNKIRDFIDLFIGQGPEN
jgi:hypothetical protein